MAGDLQDMESLDTAVDPNFDYMYKTLIVGNSGVGKTAFLVRYCDDSFSPSFVSTVGIDFKVKTLFRYAKHRLLASVCTARVRGSMNTAVSLWLYIR